MPIPSGPRGNNSGANSQGLPSRSGSSPLSSQINDFDEEDMLELPSLDDEVETFSPIPTDEVINGYHDDASEHSSRKHRSVSYTPSFEDDENYSDPIDGETFINTTDDEVDDEDLDDETISDVVSIPEKPKKKGFFSSSNNKKKPNKSKKSSSKSVNLSKPSRDSTDGLAPGYTDDTFIDEKNVKLEPFGRQKKRKAKVNEFDRRRNLRQKQQAASICALVLLGLISAAGLKNAFIPPKTLTADDVRTIAQQVNGNTGFPLNSGRGFVQDFMTSYLSTNEDGGASDKILSYFYSGSLTGTSSSSNGGDTRSITQNYKAKALAGPTIYSMTAISPSTASYTVGALMVNETTTSAAPKDGSTAKWEFFNVNVYYDSKNDTFNIVGDSPTIIPAMRIGDASKLPQLEPLGTPNTDDDFIASLTPVVDGYVQGYATSSVDNHSALDQYITDTKDNKLATGLNGTYTLAGGVSNSITFTPYTTSVPGEVKAAVKVIWNDSADADDSAQFTSNYVMTLQKQANGKYLVSKFSPEYYVPGAATN